MTSVYPPLRPFARGDVWAQTAAEAAGFDARAIQDEGVPQPVLMENAGRSAAAVLNRLFPSGPVVALVGAGNNGGDALVVLRTLRAWGRNVRGVLVADRAASDPLLHGWPVELVRDRDLGEDGWGDLFAAASVIIDGVLGTGAAGEPRRRQAEVIARVNESGVLVLSLDVPSGIDSSTGEIPGTAVQADVTVAFGAPKLGALLHPARALVGRHIAVEIGFPPSAPGDATARLVTPMWAREHGPARGTDTHKHQVGRALVVAGQVGMGGAAILAGRGAFRAGAGLVRVCSAPENRDAVHSAIPEAIFVDSTDLSALAAAVDASDALAIGPGLGIDEAARRLLTAVLDGPARPTVLDADALNLAAEGVVDLAVLGAGRPLLVTPHPGEMGRLLREAPAGALLSSPVDFVRHAADSFGCAVLLKGAPSLVSAPDRPISVDTQGSSDLAVAGMGDALTGVCVGLMAQGLEPTTAASVGLYLSGRAAQIAGRGAGLTPSDVLRWLPQALAEEGASRSDLALPFVLFDADPAR